MKRLATLLLTLAPVAAMAQPLPADMVKLTVTTLTDPSPGFIYLAPHSRVVPRPFGSYLMVHNRNGGVVGWHNLGDMYPWDFKVLPDGSMAFTEYGLFNAASKSMGVYIMDTAFTVVEQEALRRGYPTTQHDFLLLPNGNRIIVGAEDVTMDLVDVVAGGHPATNVVQAVFQEVEPDGDVVFQWKSLDHIPVETSYDNLAGAAIRYIHNNAIWEDDDGNFLLSMRHIASIVKVHRTTGEVLWVLGGKLNQFTITGDHEQYLPLSFSYQHDIRRIHNGNITMLDNGTQHDPQNSRAVEYRLDEERRTAEMVWEYRQPTDVYISNYGSVQTLDDGHRLITWGTAVSNGSVAVTEVDSNRTVVFEATYPKTMYPYRAQKHPFWPPGQPSASVTVRDILADNTYRYLGAKDTTGVTVHYNAVEGGFYTTTTARRFMYAPQRPRFTESRQPMLYPVRVDFVTEHVRQARGRFEFDVARLGLTRVAERLVVYRRDSAGATGPFVALPTSYDAARGLLVVDDVPLGEFAFGIPQTEVVALAPRLQSPVGGGRVSASRPPVLRISPQGRCRTLLYVVATDPAMQNVVHTARTADDAHALDAPLPRGTYYWRAGASTGSQTDPGTVFTETVVDSFVVDDDYVAVVRPLRDTVWSHDVVYPVSWRTTLDGDVRVTLERNGQVYVIADSIPAIKQGVQWRVPLSVPVGTGYHVVVRSLTTERTVETISASTVTVDDGTVSVAAEPSHDVTIAPNPASTRLYVGGSIPLGSIAIHALNGERLLHQPVDGTGTTIDIRGLPAGAYMVVATDRDGRRSWTRTVVLQ